MITTELSIEMPHIWKCSKSRTVCREAAISNIFMSRKFLQIFLLKRNMEFDEKLFGFEKHEILTKSQILYYKCTYTGYVISTWSTLLLCAQSILTDITKN